MSRFSIKYEVSDEGWADIEISDGLDIVRFPASYIYDSLRDLAEMALKLRKGAREAKAIFMTEPGSFHLMATSDGQTAKYSLRRHRTEKRASDYSVSLEGNTPVHRIVHQVTQILYNINQKIGPTRYKELWRNQEFPTEAFEELHNEPAKEK